MNQGIELSDGKKVIIALLLEILKGVRRRKLTPKLRDEDLDLLEKAFYDQQYWVIGHKFPGIAESKAYSER